MAFTVHHAIQVLTRFGGSQALRAVFENALREHAPAISLK